MGVGEEGYGNEHQVSKRKDDEDFKVSSFRGGPEDQHSEMKQRKGDNELAGDNAPGLCVKRLPKRTQHSQSSEKKHGEAEPGKEWDFVTERHSPQGNEEHKEAECDSVGVKRKQVGWPKQENGHSSQIKDRGKSQSQVKRAKQKNGSPPKLAIVTVPG